MRTLFLILFLAVCGMVYPQITITHSDYVDAWEPGSTHVNYATPIGEYVSVFVGTKSDAPQTWDFTDYTINQVGTGNSIEPSSAPVISEFPDANAVLFTKSYPTGDTIIAWQYQRIDTDRLLLYGVSDETSAILSYDPPVVQAMIPLAYGITWITQRDSTVLFPPYYVITETTATVDAFGTLIIPSGSYDCLRLTLEQVGVTVTPFGGDTTRSRSYHFYTKNMVELNILGITQEQFNETTIDVMGFNFSVPDNAGSAGETSLTNSAYYAYPNPFQHSTTIRYHLTTPGEYSLKIYDYLGKEVRTFGLGSRPAGQNEFNFNADGLPHGVYLCQLKSGLTMQNIKLVLTN